MKIIKEINRRQSDNNRLQYYILDDLVAVDNPVCIHDAFEKNKPVDPELNT